MGEKMRVSQHCGRSGSARHNDRTFLEKLTAEQRAVQARHIRENGEVQLFSWDGNTNFRESEMAYYATTYAAGLEARNARYLANSQPERCRSLENLYTGQKTRPEEVILQIGCKDNTVNVKVFTACVKEWNNKLVEWSRQHGRPLQILNVAIHADETTPHAHIRRVWNVEDKFGYIIPNQNQALKKAGIEPPHPEKPEGRYNNRKMQFDAFARELWQEICKAHGLEIQAEPRPNARHKDKQEYIYSQMAAEIAEMQQRADRTAQEAQERIQEAQERLLEAFPAGGDINGILELKTVKTGILRQEEVLVVKNPQKVQSAVEDAAALTLRLRQAEKQLQETKKQLEQAKAQLREAQQQADYYKPYYQECRYREIARELATGERDLGKYALSREWRSIEPYYNQECNILAYKQLQQKTQRLQKER